jgi:nitrous oxidase accessory protein NosD
MKISDNLFFLNECCLRIQGSRYCEVMRNQFNDSNKGIYFCCGAMSNMVYHNSFMNIELWNADDQVSGNDWSNYFLMEGNYWDDYYGVDKNNDGIGDIPYNITIDGKQDLFPLMSPYRSFHYY